MYQYNYKKGNFVVLIEINNKDWYNGTTQSFYHSMKHADSGTTYLIRNHFLFVTERFYEIMQREGRLYVRKEKKFGLYDEVRIYTR